MATFASQTQRTTSSKSWRGTGTRRRDGILDFALYQYVAGYLVRPVFPLGWLVLIVIVAIALRTRHLTRSNPDAQDAGEDVEAGAPSSGPSENSDPSSAPGESSDPSVVPVRPAPRDPRAGLGETLHTAFWLTITGRRQTSPLRRAELLIYAVLVACILIALANTNPTLRDMIDTIR